MKINFFYTYAVWLLQEANIFEKDISDKQTKELIKYSVRRSIKANFATNKSS